MASKLQLYCAVGVSFGGNRRENVTSPLCDHLHWLQVRECITFNYVRYVTKQQTETLLHLGVMCVSDTCHWAFPVMWQQK